MDSTHSTGYTRQVLLLESAIQEETHDLVRRLGELGVKTTVAVGFDEALRILRDQHIDFGAVFIPTRVEESFDKKTLAGLSAEATSAGLTFVSVGTVPAPRQRRQLRKAGVMLAIWNPLTEGTLRFQLNRAFHPKSADWRKRDNPRVPTNRHCRINAGGRQKIALIYNLSASGAFLETPRASMTSAEIEVELQLAGDEWLRIAARVVYCNVPGNLQRPELPLGMGVSFYDLDREERKSLRRFVDQCLRELEVG